jgi:hypothetical protein
MKSPASRLRAASPQKPQSDEQSRGGVVGLAGAEVVIHAVFPQRRRPPAIHVLDRGHLIVDLVDGLATLREWPVVRMRPD